MYRGFPGRRSINIYINIIDLAIAIANSNSDSNFDDLTDSNSIAKFKNENFYNILRQMAAEMDTKEEETAIA
jgi:hypothetical protein